MEHVVNARFKDSKNCCADFYFVDGTCKPCEPGFFGPNCRASCPYPNYGHRCTEMCECPKDQCDVSEGCKQFSLQPNTTTISTPDPNPNKQEAPTAKYNVNTEQTANEDDLSDNSSADSLTSDKPLGNSSLLLIVILSSTSSLVISVVVIAFVVCHRRFRSKGRQSSLRRRSTASTRRPATSYYEIDDCAIALDTLSCRQSNVDMYMNLEKTKVERSKYATLTQLLGKK